MIGIGFLGMGALDFKGQADTMSTGGKRTGRALALRLHFAEQQSSSWHPSCLVKAQLLRWMDKILRQIETIGSHCLLVFTGESSFPGFLGGKGCTAWYNAHIGLRVEESCV